MSGDDDAAPLMHCFSEELDLANRDVDFRKAVPTVYEGFLYLKSRGNGISG
jgi:hypothetical protein